ncbi:MAG: LVIVD repeat-containing protein, partial [Blastocatellia bacterium]
KLAVVNDEAINENGDEDLNVVAMVDLRDESRPRVIAVFPQPVPPPETGLKNFFVKGGRFGPHNQHHWNHQACLENREDVVYLTYFNAGLRAYDIRDERTPKEIAYFIPPDPKQRIGTKPVNRLVAQVEDVIVDRRGFIYISEKNQGIFILRLKKIWPY